SWFSTVNGSQRSAAARSLRPNFHRHPALHRKRAWLAILRDTVGLPERNRYLAGLAPFRLGRVRKRELHLLRASLGPSSPPSSWFCRHRFYPAARVSYLFQNLV